MDNSVIFLGSATLDHTYIVRTLPQKNDIGIITSYLQTYGGHGVVPAVTFALLGGKAVLFTAVGRDFCFSGFEAFLQKNNVNISLITINENQNCHSTRIFIEGKTGESYTFFQPQPLNTIFLDNHAQTIEEAELLYVTSNRPEYFTEQCLRKAQETGVKVITGLDLGLLSFASEQFLRLLLDLSVAIILNEFEWKLLMKRMEITEPNVLFKLGTKLECVYLTKGEKPGIGYLVDSRKFTIPIFPSTVIKSSVGAGDTFSAGVIWGLIKRSDYEKAAHIGSFLASKKVEVIEPTIASSQASYILDQATNLINR